MEVIGKYQSRQIFWLDYTKYADELPEKNWLCLAISNVSPNSSKFDKFVRTAISKDILEFKGHGKFGEKLHDMFDETMLVMETMEDYTEIDVMTTWHNNETLADVFWQCFFATCLPETADHDNIKIICTDLEGINRSDELKNYIKEFELGWLPSDNIKHEVWQDKEGLTMLCFSDESGDAARAMFAQDAKLIYEFYANSHFDAMTIYYKFMDWGIYETEFEIDKEPYDKINKP